MQKNNVTRTAILAAVAGLSLTLAGEAAFAASSTWLAAPADSDWNNTANWDSTNGIPGAIGAFNGDTATFGTSSQTLIEPDADRYIDTASFANNVNYTVGADATTSNALTVKTLKTTGSSGTITLNAPLTYVGDGSLTINSGQTLDVYGALTQQNGKTILVSGAGTINFHGMVQSDSNGGNYPGLRLLGSSGDSKVLNFYSASHRINLTIDGGQTATANLNVEGAIDGWVSLGTGIVNVNVEDALNGTDATKNVTIIGSVSGTKSAVMEVKAGQSYKGNTTVGNTGSGAVQGTAILLANNASGSATGDGDVRVVSGLLGGNGIIVNEDTPGASPVARGVTLEKAVDSNSLATYAHLSPGASAGAVGTLTFDLGSKGLDITGAVADGNTQSLLFDLNTADENGSDLVKLLHSTVLKIGSGVLGIDDFAFTTGDDFGPGTYTLFTSAQTISGDLASNLSTHLGTGNWLSTLSFANNNQDIVLTVVPEPASLGLLALGALGLLARRRRMA